MTRARCAIVQNTADLHAQVGHKAHGRVAAGFAAATHVAAMQLWHRLLHQALHTRRHTIWL